MTELEPITREERLLNSISEGTDSGLEPLTREEHYLSAIAGESDLPADMTPITRKEIYLQKIYDNGGSSSSGGEITQEMLVTNSYPNINFNVNASAISAYEFNSASGKTFRGDNVTSLGSNAFQTSTFKALILPKVTTIAGTTAGYMKQLKLMVLRECTSIQTDGCRQNGSSVSTDKFYDLGNITSIGTRGFYQLNNGKYIFVLRNAEQVCSLSTNGMSGNVEIYVPSALVDNYKAATNWSAFADDILPLEGSPYENENWWESLYAELCS